MTDSTAKTTTSRRELLAAAGKMAALTPVVRASITSALAAQSAPLNGIAGVDRVAALPGRTYLRGWVGYGEPPKPGAKTAPAGPATSVLWSKESGPGNVKFADPRALSTTATFAVPGAYVIKLTASSGTAKASSSLHVKVETPPPARPLEPVATRRYRIESPLWNARIKALIVNWIPYCVAQMNRTDLVCGAGGIDNFVEAGRKLRGEPHGNHKGWVFANAWVHQTVEAMSIALMVDARGDREILDAQEKMKAALEDWIPKILSAQEPDGYLQTAFTLPRVDSRGKVDPGPFPHWERRDDHEGYCAGYFLEAAINHFTMTNRQDVRLYNAAKKLADCWYNSIGPAPKKPWYDNHQEMELALVRFGRFVNEVEGGEKGRKYSELARFLLDCRYTAARNEAERREYDQSHLPVIEQYEAVGHSVRALYSYSGMADIAMETGDPDYRSAVKSIWDNLVHRKYYVTGGLGSHGNWEGFGPDYSLANDGYLESCASCAEIIFQSKMNRLYHDARYADLYEETLYNALLGSLDLQAKNFYYPNPLDEAEPRGPWHSCPCCVGNIPRTLLMLPTWMYAKGPEALFVNLYVGSDIEVENVAGVNVRMVQSTDYPWSGKVAITVEPDAPKRFAIHLRAPGRNPSLLYKSAPDADGIVSIAVNGAPIKPRIEKGYTVISRAWKPGDRIELLLPMKVQRVKADERIEATRGKVALRYGPLMYNIEKADQDISKALGPNAVLTSEWIPDLLGGVVAINSKFSDGSPMRAIPHFVRMNRGPAPPPRPEGGDRRAPLPVASVVWMKEG